MTNPTQRTTRLAWLESIRWRLPLTYAAIVLLTVFTLATVLLLALDSYYTARETAYLTGNARAFAERIQQNMRDPNVRDNNLRGMIVPVSFLSRSRIRILGPEGNVIIDSATEATPQIVIIPLDAGIVDAQLVPADDGSPIDLSSGGFSIQLRERANSDKFHDGERRPPGPDPLLWANDVPFGYDFGASENDEPAPHSDVVVTEPLRNTDGELVAYLELSEGPAFGTDVIQGVIRHLLLAAALVVPLATVIGWGISRNLSQPVMHLTRATEQMAAGDLATRVEINRVDELGTLAKAFNGMATQIETTVKTLQHFVADAAHEIKTPITAMRTNLELAETAVKDKRIRSDLMLAQHELNRLERLTSGLLALARLESGENKTPHAPLDLAILVRQMHEQFASRAEQAGITLDVVGANTPVMIQGDREQIIRMLENLIENAVKFTPEDGRVTIELTQHEHENVQLQVTDTGIGIPADDLPHLFARFRRGRNAAAYPGNGLGLVIAKTIVEDHMGNIAVESTAQGTTFTVTLPQDDMQGTNDDTFAPYSID